uniref:Nanos n=1 Tax=Aphaenogaster rudis TaxID=500656 RepID=B2C5V3_9HYME|nr:nanos [Aphaenogaster rudis]
MEEFRHNGRDFEYCPDGDTDVSKHTASRRKKNKKPLPTECVFCKNNGVEETYYREHLIRYIDGRTQCPVLRAYTCPICGATGDDAHTVKYCSKGPYNSNTNTNYTGKRRSK